MPEKTKKKDEPDIAGIQTFSEEKLYDLLSPMTDIELEISKGFEGLSDAFVILLLTDSENYSKTRKSLMRLLVGQQKLSGVYISLNKKYQKLKSEFEKEVDLKKIEFVDLITKEEGDKEAEEKNVHYLKSPTNLEDLMLLLDELLEKNQFLILDSISTLLLYNEEESTEKFAHVLIGKLNKHNNKGILLAIETRKGDKVVQVISQFCDKVVKIKKED